MVSRSPSHFDGFWRNSPAISSCVYSSFACSSTWCVHSRALHALLRGPTPALKEVVKRVLYKHVPAVSSSPLVGGPRGGWKGGEGVRGGIFFQWRIGTRGVPRAVKGIESMFDVALHMETEGSSNRE